jgi:hypothetical protein
MGKIELKSRAKDIEIEKQELVNKILEKPIEEITPQDFYFLNEDDRLKLLKRVAEKFKGWDWKISTLKSIPKITVYFESSYCIIEVWDDFFFYGINKKGKWNYSDNFTKIGDLLKYFKDEGLLKENKIILKSRAKENEEESIKFYSDRVLKGFIEVIPENIFIKLPEKIKTKFIDNIINLGLLIKHFSPNIFKHLSSDLKLKYIEYIIEKGYYLSDDEFNFIPDELKLKKIKQILNKKWNLSPLKKEWYKEYKEKNNITENKLNLKSRVDIIKKEREEKIDDILKKPLEEINGDDLRLLTLSLQNISPGELGAGGADFSLILKFYDKVKTYFNNLGIEVIDKSYSKYPGLLFVGNEKSDETMTWLINGKMLIKYKEWNHDFFNMKNFIKTMIASYKPEINTISNRINLLPYKNIKENKLNLKSRANVIKKEKEEYVKELYDKIKPLKGVNWNDIINFSEIKGEEKIVKLIVDYFKPYIKHDIFLYFKILNSSNYLFIIRIYKQSIELIKDEEIVKDIFFKNTDEMLEIIQNLIDTYSIKKQSKLSNYLKENKLNLKSRAKEQFQEKVNLINSRPITSHNYSLVLDDEYNPQKELIDLVSDEKKKEIIDISETIKDQYKRIKLNEEKVKDILNKEGLLKDNLTMNPDINDDEWFGLNKIFFGYYYEFDIDIIAEYNIETDKLSIDWDIIKIISGDYKKRIDEQNSELEGKEFTIPPFVKEEIKNKQKEYGMSTKRSNYLINQNTISYYEVKRLKNFFDNNSDGVDFYLAGGNEMKGWVNNILNQYRGQIHNKKKILYDIGLDNQFKKTHTKDNNKLVKPELGIKKLPLKSRNIFYNLSENKLNLKSRAPEYEKEKQELIKNIIGGRDLKDLSYEELKKIENLNYDLTPFFFWLGEELKKYKPFLKYKIEDFYTKNEPFFNNKKYLKIYNYYFDINILVTTNGFKIDDDKGKYFQNINTLINYFIFELLK